MMLILEHFDEVVSKSDMCFLRKSTVKLARLTGTLFCNDATISIATMQVILNLHQIF